MSRKYSEEFRAEAVKQVTERGRPVAEVARTLGVAADSMYAWLRKHRKSAPELQAEAQEQSEVRRLQAELRRVTEERDILKKAAAYFAKQHG